MPILTPAYTQTRLLSLSAIALANAAVLFLVAQRSLSPKVRLIRRRVTSLEGELNMDEGSVERIDRAFVLAPAEKKLRAISWAMMPLALAFVLAHRGH